MVALTVVATLLVVWIASAAADAWRRLSQAGVRFDTDDGPLIAEFIAEEGQQRIPAETVPMQHAVPMAAGRHRVRVSGESLLGQEYTYWLRRGEELEATLNLEPHTLWRGLEHQHHFYLVELGSDESPGADVLLVDDQGIRLHEGKTAEERWRLNLAEPSDELLTENIELIWPWHRNNHVLSSHGGVGSFSVHPWIIPSTSVDESSPVAGDAVVGAAEASRGSAPKRPSFDLNSDGTHDLIVAARHQPWLLAISGQDGTPLWTVARGSADVEKGRKNQYGLSGAVAHAPVRVADQNGDGVHEFLVLFVDAEQKDQPRRWLELISGADGKPVWKYELPQTWFDLDQGTEVPYHLRWFHGSGGGYSSSSSGGGGGSYAQRRLSKVTRSGSHLYLPTRPHLDRQSGVDHATKGGTPRQSAPHVMFVAGQRFVEIDLATGRPLRDPPRIDVRPHLQPRHADLDGDGQLDLLVTEQLPQIQSSRVGSVPRVRLSAWSPVKGEQLWQQQMIARFPIQPDEKVRKPEWPITADLDGDGASEVISPHESTISQSSWRTPPSRTLRVLGGAKGQPRWRRELRNLDQQISHLTVGPDIDGDRWRDIFVPTLWGEGPELFVDCLSGRDGRSLWRAQHRVGAPDNHTENFYLTDVKWYRWGGDGWPQLVVLVRNTRDQSLDRGYLFSSGTGRLVHLGRGISQLKIADLDGDQVSDLVSESGQDGRRLLSVYRGHGTELWRQLSPAREVVGDMDGDGVRDLVAPDHARELAAYSGATGEVLWRRAVADASHFSVHSAGGRDARYPGLPQNPGTPKTTDLDGDGRDDLLLVFAYRYDSGPLVQAMTATGCPKWWCFRSTAPATQRV